MQLGITNGQTLSDWTKDIQLAKASKIDGFALNAGPSDSYGETQLALAYQAAEQNNFKVFISFDMVGNLSRQGFGDVILIDSSSIGLLWDVAC